MDYDVAIATRNRHEILPISLGIFAGCLRAAFHDGHVHCQPMACCFSCVSGTCLRITTHNIA